MSPPVSITTSLSSNSGTTSSVYSPLVEHNCYVAGNLWYYDNDTRGPNPSEIYSHLISAATSIVRVWDPYVHASDAILFRGIIPNTIMLQVFTGITNSRKFLIDINDFKIGVEPYVGRSNLDVRYYNKLHHFHDRYLFIDNIAYKVGSSIGYHCESNKPSHAIVQVDEMARQLLMHHFEALWQDTSYTVRI